MADIYLKKTYDELYRWFDILNEKFFNNSLKHPIITIQKTRKGTEGWFTCDPVWKENGATEETAENVHHEICISAQYLEIDSVRSIEEIVGVLLHQMCHYNNAMQNVKDISGRVHNKKFMNEALRVGLAVEKNKSVGYGVTYLTGDLKKWIKEEVKPDAKSMIYYRTEAEKPKKEKETKVKYHYVCPKCNKEFTLKSEIPNIKCGDCDEVFKISEET